MILFRVLLAASAISIITMPGCSETSSIPKTIEVSGTVTLNGTPLTEGMVNFSSASTGDGAIASLGTEGRFLFSNGVLPGSYRVTITPQTSMTPPGPGVVPPTLKNNIPAKYTDPASTDLKAAVSAESSEFKFELK